MTQRKTAKPASLIVFDGALYLVKQGDYFQPGRNQLATDNVTFSGKQVCIEQMLQCLCFRRTDVGLKSCLIGQLHRFSQQLKMRMRTEIT